MQVKLYDMEQPVKDEAPYYPTENELLIKAMELAVRDKCYEAAEIIKKILDRRNLL